MIAIFSSDLAYEWKVDEAIEVLGRAVAANTSQNASLASLGALEHLERVREWMNKGYRFCPSGYNASCLTASDGKINYDETAFAYVSAYRWGSRGEENRIFGVKPFRYLERLMDAVWDDRWVPGYVEDRAIEDYFTRTKRCIDVHAEVDDGHTVTTAAGTFENCLRLTLVVEKKGETEPYYFRDYAYTHCGKKEFYFARGIGIVRFDCTWGECLLSRAELTSYENPTHSDAYLPLTLGCAWTYDEMNLTEEGYRARRWIKVAAGMNGRYLIHDAQEFVYLGTEEEYEAFNASLAAKG